MSGKVCRKNGVSVRDVEMGCQLVFVPSGNPQTYCEKKFWDWLVAYPIRINILPDSMVIEDHDTAVN